MNSIKLIYISIYIYYVSGYDNDFYTLNKELTRYVDIYSSANFKTNKKTPNMLFIFYGCTTHSTRVVSNQMNQ